MPEAFWTELAKLGAISDDQARQSLDRYNTLERSQPSAGQVARYAGIGALAGPAARVMGNVIKKKSLRDFGQELGGSPIRGMLGDAAAGALSGGAVPLVRSHLDRQAEMGTLKKYLKQNEPPTT